MISCEKLKSYSNVEFQESSLIYNQLELSLDKEFSKVGKKYYSYLSWWFFKTTFEKKMRLTSNLVLANWFALIEKNKELISVVETEEYLEENYILHKTFLNNMDKNYTTNIEELLNHNKEENLNVIASIWLNKNEMLEAISNFLQLINKNKDKYLKTSFRNIIYYENENWFKKSTIKKHKWKKKYQYYIDLNTSNYEIFSIANNNELDYNIANL